MSLRKATLPHTRNESVARSIAALHRRLTIVEGNPFIRSTSDLLIHGANLQGGDGAFNADVESSSIAAGAGGHSVAVDADAATISHAATSAKTSPSGLASIQHTATVPASGGPAKVNLDADGHGPTYLHLSSVDAGASDVLASWTDNFTENNFGVEYVQETPYPLTPDNYFIFGSDGLTVGGVDTAGSVLLIGLDLNGTIPSNATRLTMEIDFTVDSGPFDWTVTLGMSQLTSASEYQYPLPTSAVTSPPHTLGSHTMYLELTTTGKSQSADGTVVTSTDDNLTNYVGWWPTFAVEAEAECSVTITRFTWTIEDSESSGAVLHAETADGSSAVTVKLDPTSGQAQITGDLVVSGTVTSSGGGDGLEAPRESVSEPVSGQSTPRMGRGSFAGNGRSRAQFSIPHPTGVIDPHFVTSPRGTWTGEVHADNLVDDGKELSLTAEAAPGRIFVPGQTYQFDYMAVNNAD